jgi:hypothetical protein
VAAGIAVELGLKKLLSPPERGKLTTVWSLSELQHPLIVTEGAQGIIIPKNARVVTAGQLPPDTASGQQVRTNAEVRGSFAVDSSNERALLFLGGMRKGALALWTVDENLIARLRSEFNRVWTRSLDYVENVTVAEVPGRANATVRMTGRVEDVVPYRDGFLLRLHDQGESVGVLVGERMNVAGRRVTVTGIVRPGSSGFTLVEALEVKPVGAPQVVSA